MIRLIRERGMAEYGRSDNKDLKLRYAAQGRISASLSDHKPFCQAGLLCRKPGRERGVPKGADAREGAVRKIDTPVSARTWQREQLGHEELIDSG
jgi:hypothetical protein